MFDHEGHLFGRYAFCGDDQVAFVFARGGVEDDYEFVVSYVQGRLEGEGEGRGGGHTEGF